MSYFIYDIVYVEKDGLREKHPPGSIVLEGKEG